ncbi:hypothetical protein EDB89DRAFT_2226718 [Lactarius sanguifluus]|nr:hypothetical protein EDB89DRAFT_2226718 [Lactarius sanguifluus]
MPGSPIPDIRNTFGAAFVGLLVSTTLFGLTIVQTWIYFWHYWKKDPKSLKFFIAFITVMDTLHTILCAYAVYWYLVLNFGNFESLGSSMWAMDIQVVISIFVGASVQLYYTRQVYMGEFYFLLSFTAHPSHFPVSQSIFIPILIVALVVLGSSFGFLFTAKEFILKQFARFHSLTWIPKTGYARTDSIIMTLMAYSINSGLLTSVLAGAMTISFVVSPSSLVWLAFFWAMSKCTFTIVSGAETDVVHLGYANSLLAMLNSRDHIRYRSATDNPDNAFNLSSIRIEPPSDTYGSKSSQPDVSVTPQHSTTSNFGRNKSDHGVEPAFEVPKLDASITHSQSQGRTSGSSA